jgi:ribosome biogenesis GTPase A
MRVRYSFGARHTKNLENIKKQRQKYPPIVDEIIKTSDLILEVLDARFPEETRNRAVEDEIKKRNKKIIFVLNKSDLVNSVEKQKLLKGDVWPYIYISSKQRRGSAKLRELIKIELRRVDMINQRERYQVGIIGYPNTGKSSLINLLSGKSSAGTGAQAGFTKGMQKIRLSSTILLLDTPGVIPREEYASTGNEALSKHTKVYARDYSKVKDPELVVASLMKDYSKELEEFYKIKAEGDIEVLLATLGKQKGFLAKAGEIDEDRTARLILKDWQTGKIRV